MEPATPEPPSGECMDAQRRETVLAELERIVHSPAFRGSRRSQEFLRYIVGRALEGNAESLKERSIGVDVFGKPADYETGEDSIVRVKASEVRKRLAQYNRETTRGQVSIDVPAGSYAPEFHWNGACAPEAPARARRGLSTRWLTAGGLAALAIVWAVAALVPRAAALDDFWAPVFAGRKPVLLCVAHPVVWRLTGDARTAWEVGMPPSSVPLSEIGRDPEHYVGFGDALALADLSAYFARRNRPVQMRIGNDTSFTELRGSPAVLIGAFTNQWTVELTGDLRFVFEREGGVMFIRDRMNPAQRWTYQRNADYAIVSRVFQSKTGDIAVAAAGLSHYGTQMAGEFLTNPAYMEQAVRQAPTGWKQRNLQLVIRADVVGRAPGPPQVVASWYW